MLARASGLDICSGKEGAQSRTAGALAGKEEAVASTSVEWPDEIDEVLAGDLTAAAAYLTPAGGAVVTGVAPCGVRDRERGTVSFTTSLGFAQKLRRILTEPRVALAFHTREHGYSASPRFVLVQGDATVDLTPSPSRLQSMIPAVEHYLGGVRRGRVWDPLLHQYYQERLFVDIAVRRIVAWPDLGAAEEPDVLGEPLPTQTPAQRRPKNGAGPRVDLDKAARQTSDLVHRVLAFRGADHLPVVVPVALGGHDASGFRLVVPAGLLPPGGRRAGLLTHSYHPQLIGLSTRMFTGWLEVAADGSAVYAPHTSKGFLAPPAKTPLLISNGLFAKYGMWQARRSGTLSELQDIAARSARPARR